MDNQTIKETLTAFGGVTNRLQFVDDTSSVKFSITTVNQHILAILKALSGFDNSTRSLIAGGVDRGNEFDENWPDITVNSRMESS